MRHTLTALLSGASLCAFAGVIPAAAQTYYGTAPTIPSQTGAPAYSYHRTGPVPAPAGECQIIAGNRVCNAAPAYPVGYGYGYPYYGYGYPYGYPPGGPIGAAVAAPLATAGAVAAAPLAATGALVGAPFAAAPRPEPAGCDKIAGNLVCHGPIP
jgi:hypothetical protein